MAMIGLVESLRLMVHRNLEVYQTSHFMWREDVTFVLVKPTSSE